MHSDSILEVSDLHVRYEDKQILHGVTFSVEPGEIMVILGTSGCGKSTLLKGIIQLQKPTQGSVRLFGREMMNLEEGDLEEILQRIGVMFQYGALLNSLTVGENVALPLEMHTAISPALRRATATAKLHQVGLPNTYDLYPRELSGGMRKRAAVARAVVRDPRLIFCDEPSAGLDPVTARNLDEMLLDLKHTLGMTMVVITHELRSIMRIADRVTFLHSGRVLFTGPLQEALRTDIPEVKRFFENVESRRGSCDPIGG